MVGCASVAGAQADSTPAAQVPGHVPSGEAISELEPERCLQLLRETDVSFSRYEGKRADSLAAPVRLEGPVAGIRVEYRGRRDLHAVMDCRLVLALLRWAPVLREEGVQRIRHASALRPGATVGGTDETSGHAKALAIDVAVLEVEGEDDREVQEDWEDRDRGDKPCPEGATNDDELLRRVVCKAVKRGLFQVVITPHHNRAHRDHVHLELVPEADWTYVR
jgi:hypothetical protein